MTQILERILLWILTLSIKFFKDLKELLAMIYHSNKTEDSMDNVSQLVAVVTDPFHAVATPWIHPLYRTLFVQSGITLTVQRKHWIGTIHDQDNMEIGLDTWQYNQYDIIITSFQNLSSVLSWLTVLIILKTG